MIDALVAVRAGRATRQIELAACLDPQAAEDAAVQARGWIKALRHARVDGEPLRRRFTFRGDSLWWFTELYLHKTGAIATITATIAAIQALLDRENPASVSLVRGNDAARLIVAQAARARGITCDPSASGMGLRRLLQLEARAGWLHTSALASRLRPRTQPAVQRDVIAAFVHRAFWRADSGDGSAEAYIGPVLEALEQRVGREGVTYVGVGPRANFRARHWWDPLVAAGPGSAPPIELFAPLDRLKPSRHVWRSRRANIRALTRSADIRQHAVIDGYDAWPLIRHELAGVALLQWPWSARVRDEAEAALDVLAPRAVLTYAEAGGWGRALVLASRARGIPSIGMQHGFIYRHWLNYLHEPDELLPDPGHPTDSGFPHPSLTLVFDRYASQHLAEAGRIPRDAIAVTGSPRLDDLVRAFGASRESVPSAVPHGRDVVLLATKHREARRVLRPLIEAVGRIDGAHLVIKTHPAETPDVYGAAVAGRSHVTVLPASAPLAPLLRACRVVATVNSTVALDAAVLGVPALVIGLPNNLSPFVSAGAMAGADDAEIETMLQRVLYDEEFRRQLMVTRRAFLERFGIGSDGAAASRAARVILERAGAAATTPAQGSR
jgi:hypothetical protein